VNISNSDWGRAVGCGQRATCTASYIAGKRQKRLLPFFSEHRAAQVANSDCHFFKKKYVFGRFSARGVQNAIKMFCKKSMSETFPKISTKVSMSGFPRFFWFYRVFGCLLFSDGSSKTLQKRFYKKNRVEKFLQKIRPKIQNRFFLGFFYHVFGRFSVRGVQKHDKKISKK
jgi:hypothetical protein